MTRRCLAFTLGASLVLAAAYLWLVLWADERNQRFYQANEPRNWIG